MMKCFRSVRKEQGEISSEINSSLTGIQLTKAYDNEKYEIEKFKELFDYKAYNEFRNSMLNVNKNIQKGMAENEDIYEDPLLADYR